MKHLSKLPRRRKWQLFPKPKRKKNKNFLYSLSDVNVVDDIHQSDFLSVFADKMEVNDINLEILYRVYLQEMNNFDHYALLNKVLLDEWEFPLFNDVEDDSAYLRSPDSVNTLMIDDFIKFVDNYCSDEFVFSN